MNAARAGRESEAGTSNQAWRIAFLAVLAACAQGADADVRTTVVGPGDTADAAVVVEWNRLAYEIAYGEDEFRTFKGQRALAMLNLAMHDALNTIDARYDRYAYAGERVEADAGAAASTAAGEVLRSEYPGSVRQVEAALAGQLGRLPSDGREAAVRLGKSAARAILEVRRDDGWDRPGSYEFFTGPGRYQTTGDWAGFVVQPGFADARPFAIPSARSFRPPPPPALSNERYTRAFQEVKEHGSLQGPARTPDQSAYAIWWMEFAEGSVNRLARRLATERGIDAWTAARLFAHLHVALYDGYIATWDSKYAYDHWRPITAIRAAADDGNPKTTADAAWQSLLPAPPFPEYVSAHAAGCAAAFSVLASVFGDETSFTMTTITAPPDMPERSFTSFTAAAAECADSRVQLGWHFRYSTDAGLALGKRVADHVLMNVAREE